MFRRHGLSDIKEAEHNKIRTCLAEHPVLFLRGPNCTGMIRSVEAILQHYFKAGEDIEAEKTSIWGGLHPDVFLYDGRELKTEEARQLREDSTLLPAIWDRRFVLISYVDRSHPKALPILLKLIEEPPDHLSIIITTSNDYRVLPTILSRALKINITPSDDNEVRWWLRIKEKDTDPLRVKACDGDPDVAEQSVLTTVRAWVEVWSSALAGSDFSGSFPMMWTARLEEASEATQIACWNSLVQMVVPLLGRNRYWAEVGMAAIEARNAIQYGRMNDMLSSTLLFKVYALAKTIITRKNRCGFMNT